MKHGSLFEFECTRRCDTIQLKAEENPDKEAKEPYGGRVMLLYSRRTSLRPKTVTDSPYFGSYRDGVDRVLEFSGL